MRFDRPDRPPAWIFKTLWLAGLYNIAFGFCAVIFPRSLFTLLHTPAPAPILCWQCIGMIVGVYGIGYICAAYDPTRQWPIVLVGLLGKILGPVGFYLAAVRGELPWRFGYINLFNDLIWIPLFIVILGRAWRIAHTMPSRWFD